MALEQQIMAEMKEAMKSKTKAFLEVYVRLRRRSSRQKQNPELQEKSMKRLSRSFYKR